MESTATKTEAAVFGVGAFVVCLMAYLLIRMAMADSYKDGREDEQPHWRAEIMKLESENWDLRQLNYRVTQTNLRLAQEKINRELAK